MRYLLAALLLYATCLLGSAASAAEDETLDVIVHPNAPVSRLSAAEVEALFTRTQTRWSDGTPVVPLSFPAGTPVRDRFDRTVLRLDADAVGRFWLDRRIRGLGAPPKQVLSGALMLKVVANLPGAIGYVPVIYNRSDVKVVARIVAGKVMLP